MRAEELMAMEERRYVMLDEEFACILEACNAQVKLPVNTSTKIRTLNVFAQSIMSKRDMNVCRFSENKALYNKMRLSAYQATSLIHEMVEDVFNRSYMVK